MTRIGRNIEALAFAPGSRYISSLERKTGERDSPMMHYFPDAVAVERTRSGSYVTCYNNPFITCMCVAQFFLFQEDSYQILHDLPQEWGGPESQSSARRTVSPGHSIFRSFSHDEGSVLINCAVVLR